MYQIHKKTKASKYNTPELTELEPQSHVVLKGKKQGLRTFMNKNFSDWEFHVLDSGSAFTTSDGELVEIPADYVAVIRVA
jgi:hypothetical protein